eukprot:4411509-Pyramimonas_sp.AAC.2
MLRSGELCSKTNGGGNSCAGAASAGICCIGGLTTEDDAAGASRDGPLLAGADDSAGTRAKSAMT